MLIVDTSAHSCATFAGDESTVKFRRGSVADVAASHRGCIRARQTRRTGFAISVVIGATRPSDISMQ
jgi:hypothetical protein